MTPDYYATLGLLPTSEDVVIRAAYRALIRRYHPDGNASTSAAARARAINAAYAVLINPEKRAEYDRMRAAEAWPNAPARRSGLPGPSRWFAAASVTVLLVLVYVVTWSPLTLVKPAEHVKFVPPRVPEVFREIPNLLPSPEVAVADTSEPEVANPQLDEPPPEPSPPAVAPDPRLSVPLAPSPTPRVIQTRVSRPAVAKPIVAKPAAPQPAIAKAAPADPMPSFNCRIARTRGEIAVCGNANLANLDRQQAMFYGQSWLRADPAKRAKLQTTRNRFIDRRDSCRSAACARAAYLARMREVSAIMIGPVKPPN